MSLACFFFGRRSSLVLRSMGRFGCNRWHDNSAISGSFRPVGARRGYPASPDGVSAPAPTTFTTKKAAAAYLADVQSDIERGRWKSRERARAFYAWYHPQVNS